MARVVKMVIKGREQPEGHGAKVRRSIGSSELRTLDPFLMLDEAEVALPNGFPDHPHRGFETVTYVLEGCAQHEDFAGNRGLLNVGDLQWMTAGRGIVHAEMPKPHMKGLQLWVNLKSTEKMVPPAYQNLENKDIPKVEKNGVTAAIIAGESMGVKSPVRTKTPTYFLDFILQPGSQYEQSIPEGWNCFAFVLKGKVRFEATDADNSSTVVFGPGNSVSFENRSNDVSRFVLIAGQPIGEPVVQHGPFVMNTYEEIELTFQDYSLFQNGFENARNWRSSIGH